MPIYEYKCKVCDDRFEIEQSITDDTLTVLPGCEAADDGEHHLKKVFSAVGIAFKGEGFYRNDARAGSKSSGSKESSKAESSSNGSGSSDGSSSSDSSSSGSDSSKSSEKSSASSSSSSSSD